MAKRRVPVDGQSQGASRIDFGPSTGTAAVETSRERPRTDETACGCPVLDAADWHEVESDWSDIAFVPGALMAFMGVPFGYNSIRAKLEKKAGSAGATVPDDPMLLLGSGQFRRKAMLEVDAAPALTKGVKRPGGVAFTRLVPAPPGKVKRAVKDTRAAARGRYGRNPDNVWLWFLTCHVCSARRDFETLVVAHYQGGRG